MLRQQPEQKFLLYREGEEPPLLENWLLDVQLASGTCFRTDQGALWLAELELPQDAYPLLEAHVAFFESGQRREALRTLLEADDSQQTLRLKRRASFSAASRTARRSPISMSRRSISAPRIRVNASDRCGLSSATKPTQRKDLVKTVKGNAIVPSYVLEYLLGQYCATDDEATILSGIDTVKEILRKHYVHRNEAGLVRSTIKEKGRHKLIDRISVALNDKSDAYEAELANLGVKKVLMDSATVKAHPKLLVGGVWCIADPEYLFTEDKNASPRVLAALKPIQLSHHEELHGQQILLAGRRDPGGSNTANAKSSTSPLFESCRPGHMPDNSGARVEMVEPDLAHDREVDPHDTPTPQDYAARLGAHMMDFVDYRGDLVRARRLGTH